MLTTTWQAAKTGLQSWAHRLGRARRYAAALRELHAIDAHTLKDIGLHSGDLRAAAVAAAEGRGFGRFSVVSLRRMGMTDLPRCREFAKLLHRDDIRRRFGRPVALDDADTFRRLFGLDDNRVETIAALDLSGQILGLVTIARTDATIAELALVVRSDVQRRGLGATLLVHAIKNARAAGLRELVGCFSHDNVPVRRLARRFGFEVDPQLAASARARLVIGG
jgi:GNAT superfamily N-acetyltransferase